MNGMTHALDGGFNGGASREDEIVKGVLNLLWAGVQLDRLDDLQDLTDAIVILCPGIDDGRVVPAWWHLRTRSWSDALGELRRVERAGALSPLGTALSAVCLYALRDPAWRTYAYAAAYDSDNPLAIRMALALLAAPEIESPDGNAGESPSSSRSA
jgi:type III secretion protein HrpB1